MNRRDFTKAGMAAAACVWVSVPTQSASVRWSAVSYNHTKENGCCCMGTDTGDGLLRTMSACWRMDRPPPFDWIDLNRMYNFESRNGVVWVEPAQQTKEAQNDG